MTTNRRRLIRNIGMAGIAGILPERLISSRLEAATSEQAPKLIATEQKAINAIVNEFMGKFNVPGLSICISKRGKLVMNQGFGVADQESKTPVTPDHLFRIASVSKPFTSAAICAMIEQGKLRPDEVVFGDKGKLAADFGKDAPADVKTITIHHLLTHTCGGWENKEGEDPMFLQTDLGHKELIEWTLKNKPLVQKPGKGYAYSNFGYCVLGRVLEKITGLSYAEVVKKEVLDKCGITTMRIAGNTLAEKAPNEVTYYPNDVGDPYRMPVARMDSHGGWIARAADLVHFATHVDGFPTPPDILKSSAIKFMSKPSPAYEHYACGWSVNKAGHWSHGGSLPGTSTLLVRTATGVCWAALANIRGEGIDAALDSTMWKVARAVPAWQVG